MDLKRYIVDKAKRQILNDVQLGVFPDSVKSLVDIAEHSDHNCYGGFTTKAFSEIIEYLDIPTYVVDGLINECQNEINQWIAYGGIAQDLNDS